MSICPPTVSLAISWTLHFFWLRGRFSSRTLLFFTFMEANLRSCSVSIPVLLQSNKLNQSLLCRKETQYLAFSATSFSADRVSSIIDRAAGRVLTKDKADNASERSRCVREGDVSRIV